MSPEDQLRYCRIGIIFCFVLLIAVIIVFTLTAVAHADELHSDAINTLSPTVMWALGGFGMLLVITWEVLRRLEADIIKLKSVPVGVTHDMCLANSALFKAELAHGIDRFERIESTLDEVEEELRLNSNRHKEIMEGIAYLKEIA